MNRQNIDLIRKVFSLIEGRGFMYSFYATDGSNCGCGGDNVDDVVSFTRQEILCILSKELGRPELFDGVEIAEFDLDERISVLAQDYTGDYSDDEDLEFGGYSTELEEYVETWKQAIELIQAGKVEEHRIREFVEAMNEFDETSGIDVLEVLDYTN